PVLMNSYQVTYLGPRVKVRDVPGYVKKSLLIKTKDPFELITLEDLVYNEKVYFKAGDTVGINPENTYYHVEYRKDNGRIFNLYPRVQVNPQMGFVASPDIHRSGPQDLYTHATMVLDPDKERDWSQAEEHTIKMKDTLFLNDYVAILDGVDKIDREGIIQLASNEAGVRAKMRILGPQGSYLMEPTFLVSPDRGVAQIPDVNEQLGLRINLLSINPENGEFTFSVNTTQRDYIILKAVEKPLINLLWLGTLVLLLGFGVAIYRRYDEFVKMRDKGME
ncbi:MAG: cytochrome C biogenesis protein, partial [Bacteroidota bacterium]